MQKFHEHEIEWTDVLTSRLWDYYSKTYPYNQVYYTKSVGKGILLKTESIIGSLNDKTILDFGCGPAFFIDHMIDLDISPKKYTGLDFSEDSVDNINNKVGAKFEKNGIFIQKLPCDLDDDSIDVCFLIEVIEHLNDEYIKDTLTEVYRLLKPGGSLVITTPNNEELAASKLFCPECGCIFHKWQHERKFDRSELSAMLSKYNFKVNEICELTFKTEGEDIFLRIKHLIKGMLGKNKLNLFGVFVK